MNDLTTLHRIQFDTAGTSKMVGIIEVSKHKFDLFFSGPVLTQIVYECGLVSLRVKLILALALQSHFLNVIERQTEIVLEQLKLCLETAGTSLQNVMKCNIYCTSAKHFPVVNAIYARYFPEDPPARIFVCIPEWTGPFDIEIDCVAMM